VCWRRGRQSVRRAGCRTHGGVAAELVLLPNSWCDEMVRSCRSEARRSSANTAPSSANLLTPPTRGFEVRLWRADVGVRRNDRPLDARALRYAGGAQMSTPSSGPLRPLSHTEPHTPSHTTTATRFSCCRCGFESHVDYHGRTPPFNRSIVFLEAVYLIRSPMGDANRPLCLGGTCVVWCATTNPSLSHHHAWHTLTSEPRLRAAPLAWHLMLTR